ncbi:hypothetical protein C4D60_Mb04t15330 [Musa balbisiana]|uniref:Uncharacterized protein n=1 Tax=Musa balbisiana TaxID=52838 RepID=A0A4S8KC74_MUSBA|nr:hypothetical protein C4D60_Mb04t15330 [Musa balbisiana]
MGNCLPSLAHESKRCDENKSRSRCSGVAKDHVEETERGRVLPQPAAAAAAAPRRRVHATDRPRPKRSVRFAEGGDGVKDSARVKMRVTKKEASLLLSMLDDGRERSLADVLSQLEEARAGCASRRDCCTAETTGDDVMQPILCPVDRVLTLANLVTLTRDHVADEPEKGRPPQAAQAPNQREKATPRPKRSVRFADDDGKKDVVRVKMMLTKKEAARLLAMLAGGDEGALEHMLCELGGEKGCSRSPARSDRDCWRPELESIPEN